ncbi:MAG: arginine--tRNA ligase [Bacilli bacterium]|jgi:arginyl-tRNA synthetase|nr:arginine--tRNA ligase [Bacilli bacterium]
MNNESKLKSAIVEGAKKIGLEVKEEEVTIDHGKDPSHGDYASNVALKFSKKLGKKPLELANELKDAIVSPVINKIEVAGPGFINFYLNQEDLGAVVSTILKEGTTYGQLPSKHKKINVEFVSANPTGDLHLGHTRGAALGDAIGNLYKKAGYDVTKEYYLNNCGNQIAHLGHSLMLRYHELFGEKIVLGDDDYHGQDIIKIAQDLKDKYGDKYLHDDSDEAKAFFVKFGIDIEFKKILKDLSDFGVEFDKISYESDIRKGTVIKDTIADLDKRGYVYTKDGATYLKTTSFLDDKDRPIIKADGSYTYFMPDICYHYDKMSRGFDLLVDMLGADHFGYINRMKSALMMKGYPESCLDIDIYQIVRVYKDGVEVKMSKRTGKAITHRELVGEVGKDAVRYFFSEKSGDTHLDFNMDLALSKSKDNPVYYAQYAHARCHSLLEMGSAFTPDGSATLLTNNNEGDILKHLADFPSMIETASLARAPYKVAGYVQRLAQLIHEYYAASKIIDRDNPALTSQRLGLIKACMIVLEDALAIIGVSAPDQM